MAGNAHRDRYPDGCHVHDHCLSCPLDDCIFDVPLPPRCRSGRLVAEVVRERNATIAAAYEAGFSVRMIANAAGVSPHTVWRAIRETPAAKESA